MCRDTKLFYLIIRCDDAKEFKMTHLNSPITAIVRIRVVNTNVSVEVGISVNFELSCVKVLNAEPLIILVIIENTPVAFIIRPLQLPISYRVTC